MAWNCRLPLSGPYPKGSVTGFNAYGNEPLPFIKGGEFAL